MTSNWWDADPVVQSSSGPNWWEADPIAGKPKATNVRGNRKPETSEEAFARREAEQPEPTAPPTPNRRGDRNAETSEEAFARREAEREVAAPAVEFERLKTALAARRPMARRAQELTGVFETGNRERGMHPGLVVDAMSGGVETALGGNVQAAGEAVGGALGFLRGVGGLTNPYDLAMRRAGVQVALDAGADPRTVTSPSMEGLSPIEQATTGATAGADNPVSRAGADMAASGMSRSNYARQGLLARPKDTLSMKLLPYYIQEGLVSAPNLAAAGAATYLTGGAGGIATAFGMGGGSEYANQRAQGTDIGQALVDYGAAGAAEAVGEVLPLGVMFGKLGRFVPDGAMRRFVDSAGGKLLATGMAEGNGEMVTEGLNMVYESAVKDQDIDLQTGITRMLDAFGTGAASGLAVGAPEAVGTVAENARQRRDQRRADDQLIQFDPQINAALEAQAARQGRVPLQTPGQTETQFNPQAESGGGLMRVERAQQTQQIATRVAGPAAASPGVQAGMAATASAFEAARAARPAPPPRAPVAPGQTAPVAPPPPEELPGNELDTAIAQAWREYRGLSPRAEQDAAEEGVSPLVDFYAEQDAAADQNTIKKSSSAAPAQTHAPNGRKFGTAPTDAEPDWVMIEPRERAAMHGEVADAFIALAQGGGEATFQLPTIPPKLKTIHEITRAVDPTIRVQEIEDRSEPWPGTPELVKTYSLQMPNGDSATFSIDAGGGTQLDVLNSTEGGGTGTPIYAIINTFAQRNGLKALPDHAGLTEVNKTRRTEQQAASALRTGTTEHLVTHPSQVVGGFDVGGNDRQNTGALLTKGMQNSFDAVPELHQLRYNPSTAQFEWTNGEVATDEDFSRLAGTPAAREAGVGRSTLKRAVWAASAVRATRSNGVGAGRLLGNTGGQQIRELAAPTLEGLLYSRGSVSGTANGPQGGRAAGPQVAPRPETGRGVGAPAGAARSPAGRDTRPAANSRAPNPRNTEADVWAELAAQLGLKFARRLKDQKWLTIVNSRDQIPAKWRNQLEAGELVGAFYAPNGDVFVIASEMQDDAAALIMHEVGVHYGLPAMLGKDLPAILDAFWAKRTSDPEVAAAIANVPAGTKPENRREEALAYYVQRNWDKPSSLMTMIKVALKRFASQLNIPMSYWDNNPQELLELARIAATKASRGQLRERFAAQDAAREQAKAPTEALAFSKEDRVLEMGITRSERATGVGTLTDDERAAITRDANKQGLSPEQMHAAAIATKSRFPESDGWAPLVAIGLKSPKEMKDEAIAGDAVVIDGAVDRVKWQVIPYKFHLEDAGLAEGRADEARTAELNATRADRVARMARRLVDDMRQVVARDAAGDTNAKAILHASGWYAEMRSRLRAEFGGLGDFFADLLGATSPNTPVRTNWNFAIDALGAALSGRFDDVIDNFVADQVRIERMEADLASWASESQPTLQRVKATDEYKRREEELQAWYDEQPGNKKTRNALPEYLRRKAALADWVKSQKQTVDEFESTPEYQARKAVIDEAKARLGARVEAITRTGKNAKGEDSKYGINNGNVARALVGLWRQVKVGGAPKAVNFSGNLIGFSRRATIDVWAARYLRYLAERAVSASFARVPTVAEQGVEGQIGTNMLPNGEFGFGQDVMAEASKMLRESGMKAFADTQADDLQAVVWFFEKERWGENGWTSKTGEGGSFEQEANLAGDPDQAGIAKLRAAANKGVPKNIRDMPDGPKKDAALAKHNAGVQEARTGLDARRGPVSAYVGGLSPSMSKGMQGMDFVLGDGDMVSAIVPLKTVAGEDSRLVASKITVTEGRYGEDLEKSFDIELVTRSGYDVQTFFAEMLRVAQHYTQDSAFISRKIQPGEDIDPRQHNPGVEVYFQDKLDAADPAMAAKLDQIKTLIQQSQGSYAGFTLITDVGLDKVYREGKQPPVVGVRMQYLPELDVRYDGTDLRAMSASEYAEHISKKHDALLDLVDDIKAQVEGVSYADSFWYDTEVRFHHEYDSAISDASAGAGSGDSSPWTGRPRREGFAAAARQSEIGGAQTRDRPAGYVRGGNRAAEQPRDELGRFVEDDAGQILKSSSRAADTIEVDGVERPATDSTGKRIHPTDEGIRNFWRWFGDSKVVDESAVAKARDDVRAAQAKLDFDDSRLASLADAHPLHPIITRGRAKHAVELDAAKSYLAAVQSSPPPVPVFHGGGPRIEVFRRGRRAIWMAESVAANTYGAGVGGTVYPLYAHIENPMVFDAEGGTWQQLRFEGERVSTDDLADTAESRGHDGLIINNLRDEDTDDGGDTPATHYAVFAPEQVKSALGNTGEFSGLDPRILKSSNVTVEYPRDDLGRFAPGEVTVKVEGQERPKPASEFSTSTKNEFTDRERAELRKDPVYSALDGRAHADMILEARGKLARDKDAAEILALRLAAGIHTTISEADEALLLAGKVELLKERAKVAERAFKRGASEEVRRVAMREWDEIEQRVTTMDQALKTSGSIWGRWGNLRQRILREDFSFDVMLEKAARARGRDLTDAEREEVHKQAENIKELEAALAKSEEMLAEREERADSERLLADMVVQTTRYLTSETKARSRPLLKWLQTMAEESRKALDAMEDVNKPSKRGQAGATNIPAQVFHLSRIGLAKLAEMLYEPGKWNRAKLGLWRAAMRKELGSKKFTQLDKEGYIDGALKSARKDADELAKSQVKAVSDAIGAMDPNAVTHNDVYELVRAIVKSGVHGEADVMAEATKQLQGTKPGITEREVRRIFVDYGKARFPSQEEVSKEVRELAVMVRLQESIDRLREGLPALKSGPQRDKQTQMVRQRQTELNELLKVASLKGVPDPQRLATYQDARIRNLKNMIEDAQRQLATGERPERRPPPPKTPEMEKLAAELKTLREKIREADRKSVLPTPEQRAAKARAEQLKRRIEELQQRIGGAPATKPDPKAKPTSPELSALEILRDNLQEQLNALEREKRVRKTPEERANAARLKGLERQERILKEELLTGLRPPKGVPLPTSAEVDAKAAAVAAIRKQVEAAREAANPKPSPEDRYQTTLGKILTRRIADLRAKIEAKDWAPKPKIEREANKANRELRYELLKAKHDFAVQAYEWEMSQRGVLGKLAGYGYETFSVARALMTSVDWSAVLRQSLFTLGHPVLAAKLIKPMVQATLSAAREVEIEDKIRQRPNFALYEKAGLSLTESHGIDPKKVEEQFVGRWLEKADYKADQPIRNAARGVANVALAPVRGSGRAYTTFTNLMRVEMFDLLLNTLTKSPAAPTKAELEAVAYLVNVGTGRGSFGSKALDESKAASLVLFAPRYVASRFNFLLGIPIWKGWMASSPGTAKRVARLAAMEYARYFTGLTAVYALAALYQAGTDDDDEEPLITLDPRSSDFGKIRFGNTYLDPMAGLAQAAVFGARMLTAETVVDDEVRSLGPDRGWGQRGGFDVMAAFARSKLSPMMSTSVNLLTRETFGGEPTTLKGQAMDLMVPLSLREVLNVTEDRGIPEGAMLLGLSMLGMGLQYRDPEHWDNVKELRDQYKEERAR